MTAFLLALIGAALVTNLLLLLPAGADVLRQRPGQWALLGPLSALLIGLSTPLGWLLFHGVLVPLQLDALRLFIYLPLLAAIAWLSVYLISALSRRSELAREPGAAVHQEIVVNFSRASSLLPSAGAALGSLLLAESQSFALAIAQGIGGGLGFWLALRVLADLLARIDTQAVPKALRGAPLLLISVGLAGLALLGLQGLVH